MADTVFTGLTAIIALGGRMEDSEDLICHTFVHSPLHYLVIIILTLI